MTILRIEHPVVDYLAWKGAFDRDPVGRAAGGVRSYRVQRPVDDTRTVVIDLEFDDRPRAEAFRVALETLWRSPEARQAIEGTPTVRVLESVDAATC